MDGIALTRRIKAVQGVSPIVVMISAMEWGIFESEAKSAGVDAFLAKPLFPSTIIDSISKCLGLKKSVEEEGEKSAARETFPGRQILLVEDVELNREIVLALLESTELVIDCAENGIEAVRMFSAAPDRYDMIFMDVQMPEMDGYEATRRIRELDVPQGGLPIVTMTANVFREDIEKCLDVGMDGHVGKPINLNEVLEKLHKYLAAPEERGQ